MWIYSQLSTFNLLLIPEPPDLCRRLAAWGYTRQGDLVAFHGWLSETINLWFLWYTCSQRGGEGGRGGGI